MARPIWTGSISFGLVSIPVELNVAVHEKTVHFHMLSKDGTCRLRRKLVCPETGKEYDFNQAARGIEIGPDDYVLVDQREIDRLKPEKGRSLDIVQFVDQGEIDPVFYDRVYYLKPGKDAKKPYKLLLAAMSESHKCAVGRFVMRDRQYTAMIRPVEQGMVLHTLHYADEVDKMDDEVGSALERIKLSAGEMKMAGELIKSMTSKMNMDDFKDDYREQLQALIDAKSQGKEIAHAPQENPRPSPGTINLMDALRKSLGKSPGKSPPTESAKRNGLKTNPRGRMKTRRPRQRKVR